MTDTWNKAVERIREEFAIEDFASRYRWTYAVDPAVGCSVTLGGIPFPELDPGILASEALRESERILFRCKDILEVHRTPNWNHNIDHGPAVKL